MLGLLLVVRTAAAACFLAGSVTVETSAGTRVATGQDRPGFIGVAGNHTVHPVYRSGRYQFALNPYSGQATWLLLQTTEHPELGSLLRHLVHEGFIALRRNCILGDRRLNLRRMHRHFPLLIEESPN